MGFFSLGKHGIVGINRRNLDLIFEQNSREHYPSADSKLRTKSLALEQGIQVPELIDTISWQHEVHRIGDIIRANTPCVIKPDQGSGGGGIVVLQDVLPVGFRKSSGDIEKEADLRFRCQNILSGMYSLGHQRDTVLIEKAVQFDPVFDEIAFQGVPDIRVIVSQGRALMGMLRLPTKMSDGKANLHKGGIGVGIEMTQGVTTLAVQANRYIERHPETGHLLAGRSIPYWKDMLDIAVRMQQASKLGYIGVDLVLDKTKGPMVLEINARPGISIQIANGMGLGKTFG